MTSQAFHMTSDDIAGIKRKVASHNPDVRRRLPPQLQRKVKRMISATLGFTNLAQGGNGSDIKAETPIGYDVDELETKGHQISKDLAHALKEVVGISEHFSANYEDPVEENAVFDLTQSEDASNDTDSASVSSDDEYFDAVSTVSAVPIELSDDVPDVKQPIRCEICYNEPSTLTGRSCCQIKLCTRCLHEHVTVQITSGNVKIRCPNFECDSLISSDEILDLLSDEPDVREKYNRFLADAENNPHQKTCPKCFLITEVSSESLADRSKRTRKFGLQVTCANPDCQLVWCFTCHAPWHEPITCKDYMRGDKLVKTYAKQRDEQGDRRAVRCPKCKVYIQRTEGCSHMHCSRCYTHFCYQCGEKRRSAKLLGDHNSRLGIFGCKYIYENGTKQAQRVVVRGALFGAMMLGLTLVSPIALPTYGVYCLIKKVKRARRR